MVELKSGLRVTAIAALVGMLMEVSARVAALRARLAARHQLTAIVSAFGTIFPLRKASSLGERSLVQRLPHASEGITGPVTRLFSLAAVEAIRSSSEFIDAAARMAGENRPGSMKVLRRRRRSENRK